MSSWLPPVFTGADNGEQWSSTTVTSCNGTSPGLVTANVNVMLLPCSTCAGPDFSTSISGQSTRVVAVSSSEPSLPVVTEAVFSTAPQSSALVGAVMCTDASSSGASVPKSHVSVPLSISQAALAGSIVQAKPPGSSSVTVTPCSVPAPVLVTVIVNPMSSPASTDSSSATLSMTTTPHWTVTESSADSSSSLLAETVASLLIVAHDCAVVGELMCTVRVASSPRSPKSHVSVPESMSQSGLSGSSVQLRPGVAGSGSDSVTSCAVPGPLFLTVIVKPMSSPASTVPSSAIFVIAMSGHCTVTVSSAETSSSLSASAVATFLISPHDAAVVGELMCTVRIASSPRSPKSHCSVPPVMSQSGLSGSSVQLRPGVAGSGSDSVTSCAVPGPLF